MVVMIPYEGSFTLTAYATGPGYQSIAPQGYVYEDRGDGRYVAPLLPELFYGVNGQQLQHTWRQYIPSAGDQVVLSRSGGNPRVPREDLAWRRVTSREARTFEELPTPWWIQALNFIQGNWLSIAAGAGALAAIVVTAYYVSHW